MKKIITAITLASLLGCEQTPKQKSVDATPTQSNLGIVKGPQGELICRYGPDPKFSGKKHEPHAFMHDSIQAPKQFSGTIKGWVANIGELCNADGLPMDVYTFVIETNKGEKELTVIGYEDSEKQKLKTVASVGTGVKCNYAVYASTSDMVTKTERYHAPCSSIRYGRLVK